ncbi:hypothetical protein [Helicobacter sp. T3_23-1056]
MAFAWQSTKKFCHTKQSKVSQNIQINRDISGFALNMTSQKRSLNMTKSSNPTKTNRHYKTSTGSRGNPQCDTETIDCHEFAKANSRNDKMSFSKKKSHPLPHSC